MPRLFARLLGLFAGLRGRLRGQTDDVPTVPPPARESREAPRVPKKPPYDLAKDSSTDNQKYLM
jgi:hypothetical protein